MAYNLNTLKVKVKETEEWLQREFSAIRTGRASPVLLDIVNVEAYGTRMPLNQVASISIEDARTLRITPYDPSVMKDIEKGIIASGLGISPAVDESGLRVAFPELSSERRVQLLKVAKEKLEDARITLRSEREAVWSDIQKQEKEGLMSEDDKFRAKDDMQKVIDEGNRTLEAIFEKKEKEISN